MKPRYTGYQQRSRHARRVESDRKVARDGNVGLRPIPEGKLVPVLCWCERREVEVAIEDVCAGVTASCGRAGCAPPQAAGRRP